MGLWALKDLRVQNTRKDVKITDQPGRNRHKIKCIYQQVKVYKNELGAQIPGTEKKPSQHSEGQVWHALEDMVRVLP